jgi:hypothetical protein
MGARAGGRQRADGRGASRARLALLSATAEKNDSRQLAMATALEQNSATIQEAQYRATNDGPGYSSGLSSCAMLTDRLNDFVSEKTR